MSTNQSRRGFLKAAALVGSGTALASAGVLANINGSGSAKRMASRSQLAASPR